MTTQCAVPAVPRFPARAGRPAERSAAALTFIADRPAGVTIAELAIALAMTESAAGQMMFRLTRRGHLVKREATWRLRPPGGGV